MNASVIDQIAAGLRPTLHVHGFKKAGRSFSKPTIDGGLVVNLQASRDNDSSMARFTLNLGARFDRLQELMDWPRRGKTLGIQDCVIQERIGGLMEVARDFWWIIEPQMKLDSLVAEVSDDIEKFALPFLSKFETYEKAKGYILKHEGAYRAYFVHLLAGNGSAARASYRSFANAPNGEFLVGRARVAAAKVGVKIE